MSTAAIGVAAEIVSERDRQDARWGEQNYGNGTGRTSQPLVSFTAEASAANMLCQLARENTELNAAAGDVTWTDILLEEVFEALAEDDDKELRAELIQVAAVAAAWVEAIDRRSRKAAA